MLNYIISMANTAAIYSLFALGLNVMWGMTGLANMGLSGFFAVGAYASAISVMVWHFPIVAGLALGCLAAATMGGLVALFTLRLRDDYLVITTLGFAEIVRLVAVNEDWLTGGTDGLSGVPGPWRGGVTPLQFNLLFSFIAFGLLAVAYIFCQRIGNSPYGRILRAIRDDEALARFSGKNTLRFKVQICTIGAGIVGLGGAAYGHYISYISPDVFRPLLAMYIFLAVAVGGAGNNAGVIVGSFSLVFFLEGSRFVVASIPAINPIQLAAFREIIIGVGLLLVLRFASRGMVPEKHKRYPAAGETSRGSTVRRFWPKAVDVEPR